MGSIYANQMSVKVPFFIEKFSLSILAEIKKKYD